MGKTISTLKSIEDKFPSSVRFNQSTEAEVEDTYSKRGFAVSALGVLVGAAITLFSFIANDHGTAGAGMLLAITAFVPMSHFFIGSSSIWESSIETALKEAIEEDIDTRLRGNESEDSLLYDLITRKMEAHRVPKSDFTVDKMGTWELNWVRKQWEQTMKKRSEEFFKQEAKISGEAYEVLSSISTSSDIRRARYHIEALKELKSS